MSRTTHQPANWTDRCEAAFLGLALGDAYGRPLEFIANDQVRTLPLPIRPGAFAWTDDTHMALYLAQAILDLPAGEYTDDAFGAAVGKRFVEWLHDPDTNGTAPGNTCRIGARAYAVSGDWRTSGVEQSDGCGAVMRICPLALAFSGETLTRAAAVQAMVTHRHPNAIQSAVTAAHLLRRALERGEFSAELVEQAAEEAHGADHRTIVADALRAALAFSRRQQPEWLDETAIPPGDGGWRSPSALGLAVAAALTWGENFETAVDKAARILGDSDTVACLTGMYLGAAAGKEALPGPWLAALKDRPTIVRLARKLALRSMGSTS